VKVAVPAFAKVGGGPAFPLRTDEADYKGMTLLDYFAAKAMEGLLANGTLLELFGIEKASIAAYSYEMASAMLKERDKWLTS